MKLDKCPGCGASLPERVVAAMKDKTEPESCPYVKTKAAKR